MKRETEMIVRRFSGVIRLYPVADVHFGAINHDGAAWKRFLRMIAEDGDAYVLLNGDLLNNNTRSSVGSPWDDTVRPREAKRLMVEHLKPIRDRIVCITSGNHERRSMKDADDDPTYDIAAKLDLEDVYRTNAAFLKLCLGETDKGEGRRKDAATTYLFAVTHGAGGGIYTGATVNRNERWGNVIDGVDCVVVGHTHKGTVTRPAKIVIDARNNRISVRDYVVISCVSWQTYGEYAMQKMLLPGVVSRPQVLLLSEKEKKITVQW